VYFNVNFNVFFKLIKVHFLFSELYISYIKFDPSLGGKKCCASER